MSVASEVTRFAEQIESLPPLPAVAQHIAAVAESPEASANDIAAVLRTDPVLAAKVLRVANSSFFGASRQITQLSRAVLRLGSTTVRNIVLGLCVRDVFSVEPACEATHRLLWQHALVAASAASLMTQTHHLAAPEEAFVAGLLHDTGQLVMLMLQPTLFESLARHAAPAHEKLGAERAAFGLDHAQAGAALMRRWSIPEPLCHVAAEHHRPHGASPTTDNTLLNSVMLANDIAHTIGAGIGPPSMLPNELTLLAAALHLSPAHLTAVVQQLDRQVADLAEILGDQATPPLIARRSESCGEIVWVTAQDTCHAAIGRTMLTLRGHTVRSLPHVPPEAPPTPEPLIVLDLTASAPDGNLPAAEYLWRQGYTRLVVLENVAGSPPRRDPHTGACLLPAVFTPACFDWVEDELQP